MAENSSGVKTLGAHHARLTVADPERSRAFYIGLLGFEVLLEFPDGVVVTNGTFFLGLRTGPDASKASAGDRFDPNRIGLDHLALSVATRDDLERAVELCKAQGITCGEIVDFGPEWGFYVLMLEDPDGIQIELTANHPA